jgi:Glycosyl transferases group 1
MMWHVHGSWATSFLQGQHDYVLPVTPGRDADGLGRARTWDWPTAVVERTPAQLRDEPIDVVVLQRVEEIELAERWLGRRPGRDVPAVFLEHNAPEPHPVSSRHPLAEQRAIPIVHVTHFNRLFWDNGQAHTSVIEHGIVDPGELYTGQLERAGVVVNEPIRRGRMVGTDLLPTFAAALPLDVFGMRVSGLQIPGVATYQDLPTQDHMHRALAQRRMYVHPVRWTSLGLSLLEAMHLGLPVIAVDATEVRRAVPAQAGVVSADVDELLAGMRLYAAEPEAARLAGKVARAAALERYGLARFLQDWDRTLARAVAE